MHVNLQVLNAEVVLMEKRYLNTQKSDLTLLISFISFLFSGIKLEYRTFNEHHSS